MSERKKLIEKVTVCLDEDDRELLRQLVRAREERDGRRASESLIVRDLVRDGIARLRARVPRLA